jgi:hypothetical protein
MAFQRDHLELMASSGAGKVWLFITPDLSAAVKAANYFTSVVADLAVGDRIHVVSGDGTYDLAVASAVKATGAVTVASTINYA